MGLKRKNIPNLIQQLEFNRFAFISDPQLLISSLRQLDTLIGMTSYQGNYYTADPLDLSFTITRSAIEEPDVTYYNLWPTWCW